MAILAHFTEQCLDLKASTNSLPIELHLFSFLSFSLFFTIGVFILRCLIAAAQCVWLHFLSWSSGICSHPGIHSSTVRTVPARLPLPVCLQTGAQAQFILWRPRRQMFTIVPLLGLKTPRVWGGLKSGGAAQLIKETTCKRMIRPFCLMVISCWVIFDGNLCSGYRGVQSIDALSSLDVRCMKYELDYECKRSYSSDYILESLC